MDTGCLGIVPWDAVRISREGGLGSSQQGWSHLAKVQALIVAKLTSGLSDLPGPAPNGYLVIAAKPSRQMQALFFFFFCVGEGSLIESLQPTPFY